MSNKVLIATRSFGSTSRRPFEVLEDAGLETVQADMKQPMTEERLIELLDGVDGAIVGVVPLTAHVFAHAPQLKIVCMHGVGTDHIDLKAAKSCGVMVANCPGANDQGVADLAFGLMLCMARDLPAADREVRDRTWKAHQGVELWRHTLGLVGLGHVGRAMAKRASGFEMSVLAYDLYVTSQQGAEIGVEMRSLEQVLEQSDFVSLHVPLTTETRNLIGAAELARMQPHAYLINTARGGIVDEEALCAALRCGALAGAALDVYADEPPFASPLLELSNVVLTPHIGAHTRESIERVGVMAARNVVAALQDGRPLVRVA